MNKIKFDLEHLYVQLHDLSVRYMKRSYAKLIGNFIGKVLDVYVDMDDTGWRVYLQDRVEINLTKPLARDCKITIMGEDMWTPIRYEKLLKFCFEC